MTNPRHVLVVGADRDLLDKVAPVLDEAGLHVHTVADSSEVVDLVKSSQFEMLVVAYPTEELEIDDLLHTARIEGAPCRSTGILLVAEPDKVEEAQALVGRGANRAVGFDWMASRLWRAIGDLTDVAPRIFLQAEVDAVDPVDPAASKTFRTRDLSTSGMRLLGAVAPPEGRHFTFRFTLPDDSEPIEGQAEVVRRIDPDLNGPAGLGARFVSFSGDGQARLEAYIRRQVDDAPPSP